MQTPLKHYIDVVKDYDTVSIWLHDDCWIDESVIDFAFGELWPNSNTLELIIDWYDLDEDELREKLGIYEEEEEDEEEEEESRRTCNVCWKEHLKEWYCIEWGEAYYCSEKCLHEHYTEEEGEELYDDGNSDSYRTEREE